MGAFFLMFVMVICIAGCGNSQENGISEQTAKNGTGTETSTDVKAEIDVMEQDSASSDKQDEQESDFCRIPGLVVS